MYSEASVARFWSKVDKSAGPDACWSWSGSFAKGYGKLYLNGKHTSAHRAVLVIAHGVEAPAGKLALHSCGNTWCVNPSHLRWGTHRENAEDARQHGTLRGGPGTARLSDETKRIILASPLGPCRLGRELGVYPKTITELRRRSAVNG